MGETKLVFGYSAREGRFIVKDGLFDTGTVEGIVILDPLTGEEETYDATLDSFGSGISTCKGGLYIEYMPDPLKAPQGPSAQDNGFPVAKIAAVYARMEECAEDGPVRIKASKLRPPIFGV